MLAEREQLNNDLLEILYAQTDSWGIKMALSHYRKLDAAESLLR